MNSRQTRKGPGAAPTDGEVKTEGAGQTHSATLMSIDNLALVLIRQGNYEEAKELYRKWLEARQMLRGKKYLSRMMRWKNLVLVLNSQGAKEDAEKLHREKLNLRGNVLG